MDSPAGVQWKHFVSSFDTYTMHGQEIVTFLMKFILVSPI